MGRHLDEPNMSDRNLLVSVEDLINIAMGPPNKNVVNYKLVQTILHIIARQMRLLEQRVEIRIDDERENKPVYSSDDDVIEGKKRRKSKDRREKPGRGPYKDKQKQDRVGSTEQAKSEKSAEKDKDRNDKAAESEKNKAERGNKASAKDTGMVDRRENVSSKEPEKGEKPYSKDREEVEGDTEKATKISSKEKDKTGKQNQGTDKTVIKDKVSKNRDEKADSIEGEGAKGNQDNGVLDRDVGKDRAAKISVIDKEKLSRGENEKADKTSAQDRDKFGKAANSTKDGGRSKSKDRKERIASSTSIVVSEVERQKEKVLVVEKGPTTRIDTRREGIEVVTRSQFDVVEALVRELQGRTGLPPEPMLPDNKELRHAIARGSASLTDTMQAMQVTARVRAAEQAISRMGDLLTHLAAAGALPEDLAEHIQDIQFVPPDLDVAAIASIGTKARGTALSRKSVAIQEGSTTKFGGGGEASLRPTSASTAASRASVASGTRPLMQSRASASSAATGMAAVTRSEMDDALRALRAELTTNVQNLTSKATTVAENANSSARTVLDKLNVALALDDRLNTLNALVADYAEQLSGFDSGITTQLQSFNDQMGQMRADMFAGLAQLEHVNNNAETTAVMDLTERCEGLASELEQTLIAHNNLIVHQRQLGDELHSLIDCIEMLREQKADRDEVLDGLRDKADNHRLAGLLTALEFSIARSDLEKRLEVCHDKFRRQDDVWMTALRDLSSVVENKANMTQLLSARDHAEEELRNLQLMQEKLALILGEPKAAVLTRELSRDAACGVCLTPALMEPTDASYGAPPPLPALRPNPVGADTDPCLADWHPPDRPDHRDHVCRRWAGGSHTLLSPLCRQRAPPAAPTPARHRYTGVGTDGRLYMLEEELKPCVECNQLPGNVLEVTTREEGAGDQGKNNQ